MPENTRDIVVIGASAGGVEALQRLVSALPGNLPASVFIVMHLWPKSPSFLAQILRRAGPLPVTEAVHQLEFKRANIYVATPDFHLMLEESRMLVVHGPRENRARPAINALFRSAAGAHRNRVIGVVLTGTLDDGAAGLWAIKRCGGIAIVQSDAEFHDMPKHALENVAVDHDVPLREIAPLLDRLVREPVQVAPVSTVAEVIRFNNRGTKMKTSEINLDKIGRRSVFSCPECNGALWELEEGVLQYRCHVGHIYSADSLKEAQGTAVESSLWSALRALKESAALDQRLADRAMEHKLDKAAQRYRQSASSKMEQAAHLQEFLGQLQAGSSSEVP